MVRIIMNTIAYPLLGVDPDPHHLLGSSMLILSFTKVTWDVGSNS